MRKLQNTIPWKAACAALLLCAAAAVSSPAQTFTTLLTFDGKDGLGPNGPLVQGLDGNLYGTTGEGGSYSEGTVFKITPTGTLTPLYSFCQTGDCSNGDFPHAGLVLATDGNFYGTTAGGGADRDGTVFEITSSGTFTSLYSFVHQQGRYPYAGLVQATDGNFYGTTEIGGAHSQGVVFKITADGVPTRLYSFCAQTNCADGRNPYFGLIQAADGNLYGTTPGGGSYSEGTAYKITPRGTLTTLYSFCSQANCADGAYPYAGLTQAANGDIYGTTVFGGASNDGTIFKIAPSGTVTTLYNFCSQSNCTDGAEPQAGLVQASDGDLYGTTAYGGAHGDGAIFKITPSGTLTTLYSFCSQTKCSDGLMPSAGLFQATDGNFYGTTYAGGIYNGTIFKLSVGLSPFVESLPTSGKVGATITILGTKLTGTTAVSFNGTAAAFTVVSETEITTTVPSGATTGFVTVTTPSGKLKSNKKFRITA